MEELHCAQLQRTSTLHLISSVTNGLSFAFPQAAQSSVTGDPLRTRHRADAPHPHTKSDTGG